MDSSIEMYKAWLWAEDYTHKKGVDYGETFSLVLRFASIRLIMTIIAKLNLKLYQIDIEITFLHGELDEEICMD